jgi:hypothetical protein
MKIGKIRNKEKKKMKVLYQKKDEWVEANNSLTQKEAEETVRFYKKMDKIEGTVTEYKIIEEEHKESS